MAERGNNNCGEGYVVCSPGKIDLISLHLSLGRVRFRGDNAQPILTCRLAF